MSFLVRRFILSICLLFFILSVNVFCSERIITEWHLNDSNMKLEMLCHKIRFFYGDEDGLLSLSEQHYTMFLEGTHAVLDPNEPGKSYIQFADGKKWYYSDMMGFNIRNVDSIALSACETAVSEKSNGGEIEGMAYQLLKKSPSGSVLASFWKVDDTATSMLMSLYYKHITDSIKTHNTLDRGGALCTAQLNLLKNQDTSHPYYWAAFTLFGDFR